MLSTHLCRKIAQELSRLSREISLANEELSGDPHVLARHMRVLQELDYAGQVLDGLTAVLRSDEIEDAVVQCVPRDLAVRLLA